MIFFYYVFYVYMHETRIFIYFHRVPEQLCSYSERLSVSRASLYISRSEGRARSTWCSELVGAAWCRVVSSALQQYGRMLLVLVIKVTAHQNVQFACCSNGGKLFGVS